MLSLVTYNRSDLIRKILEQSAVPLVTKVE